MSGDPRTLETEIRALDRLSTPTGDALRVAALAALQRASGGLASAFVRISDDAVPSTLMTHVVAVGDASACALISAFSGRAPLRGSFADKEFRARRGSWSARRPARTHRNRFSTFAEDLHPERREALLASQLWREAYGPMGISDQIRALFYDGPRLLGWVGALLDGDVVDGETLAHANRAADALRHNFIRAEAIDRSLLSGADDGAHLLLDEDGRVIARGDALATWLAAPRIGAALSHLVEWGTGAGAALFDSHLAVTADGEVVLGPEVGQRRPATLDTLGALCPRASPDDTPVNLLLAGARLRFASMRTVTGDRCWSVEVARMDPVELATPLLPPRARQVAEYAAAGATVGEIARAVGVSPNTVKDHLKKIYERLGVGSRVELADVLREQRHP